MSPALYTQPRSGLTPESASWTIGPVLRDEEGAPRTLEAERRRRASRKVAWTVAGLLAAVATLMPTGAAANEHVDRGWQRYLEADFDGALEAFARAERDTLDRAELIVRGEVSCTLALEGRIDPSTACEGQVRLGGEVIPCGDPDGWHAVDESHIELTGASCDSLIENERSTVQATFPCTVVLI